MRTMKELFEIVLAEFLKQKAHDRGTCYIFIELSVSGKMTWTEYKAARNYFEDRRPSPNGQYSRFANNPHATPFEAWWWNRTKEGWNLRREFLEQLISEF